MHIPTLFFLLFSCLYVSSSGVVVYPKRLAGHHSEFAMRDVPDPYYTAVEDIFQPNHTMSEIKGVVAFSTNNNTTLLYPHLYNTSIDPTRLVERRAPTPTSLLPWYHIIIYHYIPSGSMRVVDAEYTTSPIILSTPEVGVHTFDVLLVWKYPTTNTYLTRFVRMSVRILPQTLHLTANTYTTLLPSKRLAISLQVEGEGSVVGDERELTLYTQLWSQHPNTTYLPVCWLGGVVYLSTVQTTNTSEIRRGEGYGTYYLAPSLEVDLAWFRYTSTQPTRLVLRKTRLMDRNQILHTILEIVVSVATLDQHSLLTILDSVSIPTHITDTMHWGVPPPILGERRERVSDVDGGSLPTLLLIHGYCTATNPFESVYSSFTDASLLLFPNQSISNDKFAREILQYAEESELGGYSIVAHSQGGLAALHLYNYYWSGLDLVSGGMILQSVGSPYHGTTIAGDWATLASIFGVGCGRCNDLTLSGASLWLAGISSRSIGEVYYYTSQAGSPFISYPYLPKPYCSLLTDLLAASPNDGVAELTYSILEGATHVMHTFGECHTTDMYYPPQCQDENRAIQMNQNAAR